MHEMKQFNQLKQNITTENFKLGILSQQIKVEINDPRRFNYVGDENRLITRIQGMSYEELRNVREVYLCISGIQTTTGNSYLFGCTIIWGVLLILPLFFLLLNCWWKNSISSLQIRPQTYRAITKLGAGNLRNLILIVDDNGFGSQKSRILHEYLSQQSQLDGFTFLNKVTGYDLHEEQYSEFQKNMGPIKRLPILSDIRWNNEIAK